LKQEATSKIEKETSKLRLLLRHSDIFEYLKKFNRGEVNIYDGQLEQQVQKKEESSSNMRKRGGRKDDDLEIQEAEAVDKSLFKIEKQPESLKGG
jgi:hypothetical protein